MTHKEDIKRLRTMQRYLIDDLKKLEYHTNELIENIYANGKQKQFNKDIVIDWVVEKNYQELLDLNPDINNVHIVNLKKAKRNFFIIYPLFK